MPSAGACPPSLSIRLRSTIEAFRLSMFIGRFLLNIINPLVTQLILFDRSIRNELRSASIEKNAYTVSTTPAVAL
jgi:hypothetical protein